MFSSSMTKVKKESEQKESFEVQNSSSFSRSFLLDFNILPSYKKTLKTISKYEKIKKKTKIKLKRENNMQRKYKKIPNIKKMSYANRFLIKTKRSLYKKTIIVPYRPLLSTSQEFELFSKKEKAITREQRRHFFREKFQNYSRNKLLSNRTPKAAKIYITHVKKNTFVVIHTIFDENYNLDKRVTAKYSCGSIGYRNRKKTTDYAREQTIKTAGNYLSYNRYTNIDIIYTSHVSYWNKKALRGLIPNPIYVRSIALNNNRPHSFVRKKKAQRK